MQINFFYDPSVSSAPAGFKTALNMIAQAASLDFTDAITVNIEVGWGEFGGVPMPSGDLGNTDPTKLAPTPLSYNQLKTELMDHATSINDVIAIQNLPDSDPSGGGSFLVSGAQQKGLGFASSQWLRN
jgi:hypothetical protein